MNTVLSWHKGGCWTGLIIKCFGNDCHLHTVMMEVCKRDGPQTETATRYPDVSLSCVGEALICYPTSWVPAIVYSSYTYTQELPNISGRRNNLLFYPIRFFNLMVFQQKTSTIEVPYVLQVSVGYDFVMMLVPFLVQPLCLTVSCPAHHCHLPI